MASAQALVDELDDILQEDHSLSETWSTADLLDLIQNNVRILSSETLCRDVRASLTFDATGVSVATPSDYISCYHVRWLGSSILNIEDLRLADLLTGVTNPYATGTTRTPQMIGELYKSDGTQVLRLFPTHGMSGATCTIWYKARYPVPAALTSGVSLQPIFKLPVKFRALADAYEVDGHGFDLNRSKVFRTLGDLLAGALKTLYQGGQFL